MSKWITRIRYAKELNVTREERHTFKRLNKNQPGGFTLPAAEFPEADPSAKYRTIVASNILYENFDKDEYPFDKPLRPNTTVVDEVTFRAERVAQKQAVIEQAPPEDAAYQESVVSKELVDSSKVFFIDYYGPSYISNPTRREWFNKMFGFDPLDDDPR